MNIRAAFRAEIVLIIALLALVGVACDVSPSVSSATVTGASAPADSGTAPRARADAPPAASPAASPAPSAARNLSSAVREVAQTVKPAVVQITSEQIQLDQFNQPFAVPAGVGSGVIYDAQGHIITNNHVVEGAQRLLVSLPDGRSMPGKLVGRDPQTDLAVVQISGENLPVAELGDSGTLQVGDWVVAIGNALALPGGPTVTAGVVSALDRTIQEPGTTSGGQGPFLFDVIQTDAPINPGNSGGPLVDLDGRVIGINTLVAGQAEPGVQAQGIGFAIAVSTVKPIVDQIVTTGHATHPYLGVRYIPLNPAIASQLGISEKQGIVVVSVVARSPAASAGLQPKDVITEVDGAALQNESALAQAINSHKPGDTITLTVVRDGTKKNVKVTLGEMPTP